MWVTRDKDGTLQIWTYLCPVRGDEQWMPSQNNSTCVILRRADLDEGMFPNLKWEDEPIEVEVMYKREADAFRFIQKQFEVDVEEFIKGKNL